MRLINKVKQYFYNDSGGVTEADIDKLYEKQPSFTDLLPWVEYLPDAQSFLLEDGVSMGVMFEITPIPTEGKTHQYLKDIEENIRSVLAHAINQHDDPFILQVYVQDQESLKAFRKDYFEYIPENIRKSAFTQNFLAHMNAHTVRVENPAGYFEDTGITGGMWSGKKRRVRAFLYRRCSKSTLDSHKKHQISEEELLEDVAEKFMSQLKASGIHIRRCNGEDFYYWMLGWFNPNPDIANQSIDELMKLVPYPGDHDLPYGADFSKSLTYTQPESDNDLGCWTFDNLLHKAITIDNLIRVPEPGHLTGERRIGDNLYAVFDRMPPATILGFTIVIKPQDTVRNFVSSIRNASKGEEAEAAITHKDAVDALNIMSTGECLYPVILTAFIRGEDKSDLRKKVTNVNSLLLANGLHAIDDKEDQVALDTYIRMLPMNYEVSREKTVSTSRYMFTGHLARLLPFYGRETGTGNPGLVFFNRGAEPLVFDPLNKNDRSKNAFGLVLGPPGSGKSALMVYILMLFIARYRPRIFIIEKGGSFSLFAKHCESLGLTVNQKTLHPKNDVRLPPFSEAINMIEKEERKKQASYAEFKVDDFIASKIDADKNGKPIVDVEEEEEERDYLGEMELSARVMITGGDKKEEDKLSRSDRLLIRKAIVNAAMHKRDRNNQNPDQDALQVLTEDVVTALKAIGNETSRREKSRERAHDMAEAMELFCSGTNGHFFNRPGEMWPECDITILEMGILANEGYEDGMALGFMSLMNIITAIVERDQSKERPTIILGDEAHLFTTNPLLAPYIVKVVKMYRKLGAWLWLATQNLEDFPAESRKMLSMFEWFIAMTCPKEQVEIIAQFRDLSEEQKSMLLAAHKEPKKYTEGVVCSEKLTALFRNVPPPLALALAMTEKDEKTQRSNIMAKDDCDELTAAYKIADQIAQAVQSSVKH